MRPRNPMKIVSWEEFLRRGQGKNSPAALTIGVFDGVHAGHRRLLEAVRDFARGASVETEALAITFRENPKKILHPETYPGDILGFQDKLKKLEDAGMDAAVIIDFSAEFSKLKGADFMSLMCGGCDPRFLAIGEDFHFGCRMDTDARKTKAFLEPRGVRVAILPSVYHQGARISSTRIRGFIEDGNFPAAAAMLGHPYRLTVSGTGGARRCELSQVVPRAGSFPALFEGTGGAREGTLKAEADGIFWHYDGDVEAITFV
ncbi:MAG: FAD synthetase family protein [Spirochaetaceae bacterium]|nr:FAD synthetase family protein [Spirochaetaceae bacterium]